MELFGLFSEIANSKFMDVEYVNFYEDEMALFYDNVVNDEYDYQLYLRYAARQNGNILELACGNGRILLELVKHGYHVTGIDLSTDMLDVLRKKSRKLSKPVRNNIELYQMDMLKLDLVKRYNLVILPATTICLIGEDNVLKLFESVYQVLEDDGLFIFDYCAYNKFLGNEQIYEMESALYEDATQACTNVIFFQEKVNYVEKKVLVNFYLEKTYLSGETERYLSNTEKHMIDEDVYLDHIAKAKFIKVEEGEFDNFSTGKRKTKYLVLRKGNSRIQSV